MNLQTLILHYESIKNRVCTPNPKIMAKLQVVVRAKNAYPWQKAVSFPLLMSIDPLNDLVCQNGCNDKYCFCEKLEELVHAALCEAGACDEQHYEPECFFNIDYDGQFQAV